MESSTSQDAAPTLTPTPAPGANDATPTKAKRLRLMIPERVRTQLRRLSESCAGDAQTEDSNNNDTRLDLDAQSPNALDVSSRKPLLSPGITNFRMKFSGREPESKVLVLYTGGTIGMQSHNGVYIPEPGYLGEAIREDPHLNDESYIYRFFKHEAMKPFALPSVKGEDRRVVYWIREYTPLLDSSDMSFPEWVKIGRDISENHENYDGFVILHGTDTMCYTASALSFMFENLDKSVIVTGSQIPICEVRSDGRENLIGSLIMAGNYDIPEVTVFFNGKLFRGNRTSKVDTSSMNAFKSANIQPLATMKISISVNWEMIFRSHGMDRFRFEPNLNPNIGLLRIFPSIPLECVNSFLKPPIQGVVLQTYGAGNIPSRRQDVVEAIKAAIDKGVIVVNCTQCFRGSVDKQYYTGEILYSAGVISGEDMTIEASLAKLAYVLGKTELSLEEKKQMMRRNLRGEMTVNVDEQINLNNYDILQRLSQFLHLSTAKELKRLKEILFPPLLCQAATEGDLETLKSLKAHGALLSYVDHQKRSPLHAAASCGHIQIVKYLISEGVNVHSRDNFESTPLLEAIRHRYLDVVELLRSAGAHLTLDPLNIGVELCSAASCNDLLLLRAWVAGGADLDYADYDKRTALHVAASLGYPDIVKYLLESNMDVFAVDSCGHNCLDKALIGRHAKIVNMIRLHMEKLAE